MRGLSPEPAAVVPIDDEVHKIYAVEAFEADLSPGTWETVDGWPVLGLPGGAVRIVSLQAPGKQRISGDSWARGRRTDSGRVG